MSPTRRGPSLENRLPDEGINSSREHPLKEFAWLLFGALVTLAAVVVLVGWAAKWLAPKVPFAYEVALAQRVLDDTDSDANAPRSAALQVLAQRVAATMNLPAGMQLVVKFEDDKTVNAYATIGGRIRVFKGLLQRLPSEDALAALLAHEIAHVKHRHVAASMGRGLALSLLLSVVMSDAGAAAAQNVLNQAAGIALLGYSREQETLADNDALAAVVALYGHGGGFTQLFNTMNESERNKGPAFEVLRSHPLTQARIDQARTLAQERGWKMQGPATTMPAALTMPKTDPATRP